MARVDELVDGIYRICTTVQLPDTEFQFNQFLIDDERPALIHTGMYGLYEGVPRTDYAADWAASPNRITLFRLPLQEDFPDPRELEDEVRLTVLHELAHHLGIDDERLDELGAG